MRRTRSQPKKRARSRRFGNSAAPTLVDLPDPPMEYRGYTISFEKADPSPELWRADVWVRDVLVWPVFDVTKARAMARAVQLIDRQEAAQGRGIRAASR